MRKYLFLFTTEAEFRRYSEDCPLVLVVNKNKYFPSSEGKDENES